MKTARLDQYIDDTKYFKSPKGDLIVRTHVVDMANYGTPIALSAFKKPVGQEVERQ